MQPHDAYRAQTQASWTRIEMLLALYQGTLARLDRMEQAQRAQNQVDAQNHCMRAVRLVAELRAGLDPSYGELPQRQDQLLEFVQHCLLKSDPDLNSARKILDTLRSGFDAIREEAIRLEAEGAIPPVLEDAMVIRRA